MFVDQAALFARLRRALARVEERVSALGGDALPQPPRMTVGDEFQAVAVDAATGLAAAVLAVVELAADTTGPDVRIRLGLGVGEVIVTDAAAPRSAQSGTAWWRARDAIEAVAAGERARGDRRDRTLALVGADATATAGALAVDALLAGMDDVDARLVLGVLDDRAQAVLADDLGVAQSTVSRRLQRRALAVADVVATLLGVSGRVTGDA